MKKLSGFDLAMISAFVVVGLLGGGAWYYFSGQLATAQSDVSSAASDFEKYSSKATYLPTTTNVKILQDNISLMKAGVDPLIQAKLQSADDKILTVTKQDTVAWKHDLDDRVKQLNSAAKLHGVAVAPNFYYSFSRYLNTNPLDEKTVVLTKQLLGIEEIANILISAPVKGIQTVRRTYEEDDLSSNSSNSIAPTGDKDRFTGRAINADGGVYTDYPFEIEFEATTDTFRDVVNALIKSPYVFVIRNIAVQNSKTTSPQLTDLDRMAGPSSAPSVSESSPGAVAASAKSTIGPQYLFGGETLHIKLRIDMIEWKGMAAAEATPASGNRPHRAASASGTSGANP